jgi:hypothetical protein
LRAEFLGIVDRAHRRGSTELSASDGKSDEFPDGAGTLRIDRTKCHSFRWIESIRAVLCGLISKFLRHVCVQSWPVFFSRPSFSEGSLSFYQIYILHGEGFTKSGFFFSFLFSRWLCMQCPGSKRNLRQTRACNANACFRSRLPHRE